MALSTINKGATNLHPEVWELVFTFLDKPTDISSVMGTCKEWRGLLKSKKTVIFIHDVFPMLAKYLRATTLSACRLVGKQLKGTVDTLLERSIQQSLQSSFQFNWRHPHKVHPFALYSLMTNYKSLSADVFVEKGNALNVNPFITRFFEFQPNLERATTLVTRFGHYLKTLTHSLPYSSDFVPPNSTPLVLMAFRDLPELLSGSRNLESLNIVWNSEPIQLYEHVRISAETHPDPEMLANMTPFPPMNNLTTLNYSYNHGHSVYLGKSLLKAYGIQLTTFICSGDLWDHLQPIEINSLLPNLENLRIVGVTPAGIKKLGQCCFSLEELQLKADSSKDDKLNGNDVVKIMNYFEETLVRLEINVDLRFTWNHVWEVDEYAKELGNLKQVSTQLANIAEEDYEALLEVLSVKCKGLEVVDFYSESPHCSYANWPDKDTVQRYFQLLPKLKKIRIFKEHEKYGNGNKVFVFQR